MSTSESESDKSRGSSSAPWSRKSVSEDEMSLGTLSEDEAPSSQTGSMSTRDTTPSRAGDGTPRHESMSPDSRVILWSASSSMHSERMGNSDDSVESSTASSTCAAGVDNKFEKLHERTRDVRNIQDLCADRHIIVPFGLTGCGKSTILNRIAGCEMTVQRNPGNKCEYVDAVDAPLFKIGHGQKSETTGCQVRECDAVLGTLCDIGGFDDTRGFIEDASTCVCLKAACDSARSLRLVVVLNGEHLHDRSSDGLRRTAGILLRSFGNRDALRRCRESILLLVTKSENFMKEWVDECFETYDSLEDLRDLPRLVCGPVDPHLAAAGLATVDEIRSAVRSMKPIGRKDLFSAPLSVTVLHKLHNMTKAFEDEIVLLMKNHEFESAKHRIELITHLCVLDDDEVSGYFKSCKDKVVEKLKDLKYEAIQALRGGSSEFPTLKDRLKDAQAAFRPADGYKDYLHDVSTEETREESRRAQERWNNVKAKIVGGSVGSLGTIVTYYFLQGLFNGESNQPMLAINTVRPVEGVKELVELDNGGSVVKPLANTQI
mmetsp:Transcript_13376/g.49688  ORF Transcript_13376/g.49688 Transcript_13376/m.49688 type:complete len:546 (-) Transcript_13376:375-2012(-)